MKSPVASPGQHHHVLGREHSPSARPWLHTKLLGMTLGTSS